MNILEATLTADDRKKLSNSEFGLPKTRQFPLNDESHVRSAITFFKFAKSEDKRELAKNINSKLKKFDMKVKVGRNNPFYNYINRQHLEESAVLYEAGYSYVKGSNPNKLFDKFITSLMTSSDNYVDETYILDKEKTIYNIIRNNLDTSENLITFLNSVNNIMMIIYTRYFEFVSYDRNVSCTPLYYGVLADIWSTITTKLMNGDDNISKELEIFEDFRRSTMSFKHNEYYIYRTFAQIYCMLVGMDSDVDFSKYFNPIYIPNCKSIRVTDDFTVRYLMKDLSMEHTKRMLEEQKKQLEYELYIIRKNASITDDIHTDDIGFYMLNAAQVNNVDIREKIIKLNTVVKDNDIRSFIKDPIQFELDQVDLVRLIDNKYIDQLVYGVMRDTHKFWYGINNKTSSLYIIMKCLDDELITYKLLEINDDVCDYLGVGYVDITPKTNCITLRYTKENDTVNPITEGLTINEDGSIKITINSKKSYMDEYSETHRILVENYKNHNYEAMKYNLAFMFLLISIIEKDKRYHNRENEIVKARAFAINDFKTYLKYIQNEEPDFNFEKYYKELELDKYIININSSTITGIKNLLKNILL